MFIERNPKMEESSCVQAEEIVEKFKRLLRDGCGCCHGCNGTECSKQFSEETVLGNLFNCLELTHTELDLVILANIQASVSMEVPGEKRKRSPRCNFLYKSRPICKEMFLCMYGIS